MPILKHAKKKLRQEKKRELHNRSLKTKFKNLIKDAKKAKTPETVSVAFSAVDKAAKKNLIHKNKAAHIKSDLSKVIAGKSAAPKTQKTSDDKKEAPVKKTAAKTKAASSSKKLAKTKKTVSSSKK